MDIVRFIINPVSGPRRVARIVQAAVRELTRDGTEVELRETSGPGHAGRLAAQVAGSARAIVVVGGDGTVKEVCQAMNGAQAPIAIIPSGTENIVAKYFGFRSEARHIVDTIKYGRPAWVDMGRANGESFMIVSGVGFDAEVVARLSAVRRGHITYADYIVPLWRTYWEHRFPNLMVTVDGILVYQGRGMVFVANIRRYAIDLRICPFAKHDDGLLDVCIYPCADCVKLLLHAAGTFCRLHHRMGDAIHVQGHDILVSSDQRIPVECDGDPAGWLPVRYEIAPRSVRMLLPR